MKHYSKTDCFSTVRNILSIIAMISLCCVILYVLLNTFIEKYTQNEPKLVELKSIVTPLFNRDRYFTGYLTPLNNRDILKETELYVGNKSYSINKKKIYMCLKDEKGQYYDNNSLVFVLLHEMSHCLNNEIGHGDKFQKIFDELLALATEKGIYDPNIPMIDNYCSHNPDED
jgi:hypothetical protein